MKRTRRDGFTLRAREENPRSRADVCGRIASVRRPRQLTDRDRRCPRAMCDEQQNRRTGKEVSAMKTHADIRIGPCPSNPQVVAWFRAFAQTAQLCMTPGRVM